MTPASRTSTDGSTPSRARRVASACCAMAGTGGSALCSVAMILAAVGVFAASGSAAARSAGAAMGHMGMTASSSGRPGRLDFLIRNGPQILAISIALSIVGIGVRRKFAGLIAAVAGAVLYFGMYRQSRVTWMYVAIAFGMALLGVGYWLATTRTRPVSEKS